MRRITRCRVNWYFWAHESIQRRTCMQKVTSRALALAMVVSMTIDTTGPISAQEVTDNAAPTSGSFLFIGGPAKARRARTETTPQTFTQTGVWTSLTNGTLTYTISQNEETFSLSFSA